jgi:hypothetical protein
MSFIDPSARTPLNGSQLRQTATVVRTVSQAADGTFVITPAKSPIPTFACACLPPKTYTAPPTDGAPRSVKNKSTLWYLSRQLGRKLPAYDTGTRLSITPPTLRRQLSTVYETVSPARAERLGLTTWAWQQDVLSLSWLWPLTAALQELGGEQVASVPIALWEPSAWRSASRGTYETLDAEAAPEFLAALSVINRQLLVGTRTFRITSVTPQYQQPHVSLQLSEVKA